MFYIDVSVATINVATPSVAFDDDLSFYIFDSLRVRFTCLIYDDLSFAHAHIPRRSAGFPTLVVKMINQLCNNQTTQLGSKVLDTIICCHVVVYFIDYRVYIR